MAFCPYCGKTLQEGEVCSCTGAAGSETKASPAAPPQQGGYPPPPPPQGGYPQQGGYLPQQDSYPPQQGGYPPQQGGYPPQQGGYPPQGGYYPPRAQAPSFINPLIERIKMLFSRDSAKSIRLSIQTVDYSWALVLGAFVLLAMFTASIAAPQYLCQLIAGAFGGNISFSTFFDALTEADLGFGAFLWRALLINIIGVALNTLAVFVACQVSKRPMPFTGVLNLVALAHVPALLLTVVGFIFSFFWAAGTIILALIGSIITLVIINAGVSMHCEDGVKIWRSVIVTAAVTLLYALVLILFVKDAAEGVLEKLLENLVGELIGSLW